ncbi:MAG TPA: GNAT family N-acetyltransferase [Opitutaceae bacterium]|nr:GNAT family N-acetyltransferase [Opitutaceae bacterium]
MPPGDIPSVRHNSAEHRYEIELDGKLAVAEYALEGGRMIFTHTFVPPELRGRGLAEQLVRRALDDARTQNTRVVPACSYVEAFIRRHAEYQPLLAGPDS